MIFVVTDVSIELLSTTMITFTFFLTASAVSWFTVYAIFEDHPCETGQFKVLGKNAESFIRCQTCYMCPPGYGVLRQCTETSDTVCRACDSGYFSDSSTRSGGCRKCRPCLDEADTLRECTPNSNRECRQMCSLGDYLDIENRRCTPCSLCHRDSNVRVTRNQQCQSQGLPREWVCSSNITLIDEEGNAIDTLDTGDTYSYKDVTLRRHRAGLRNSNVIPPLGDYIRQRSEEIAVPSSIPKRSTPPETTTVTNVMTPFIYEETTFREEVSSSDQNLPEITDSKHTGKPDQQSARQATEPMEVNCDDRAGSDIIYWVVTLTYVLLIVVIAAMAIILCDYHRHFKSQNRYKGQTIEVNQTSSKCSQQCFHQQWMSFPPPPYSHQDFPRGNYRPIVYIGPETGV